MSEDPGTGGGHAAGASIGANGSEEQSARHIASRSEIEARLGAEAHLAIVRAASRRMRERLAGMLEREETAREIEHRLALRCGRLEREMQAFVHARAGEATRGRQAPVSARMVRGGDGWEPARRVIRGLPAALVGALAGLLVAAVVIAAWRPERAPAPDGGERTDIAAVQAEHSGFESEERVAQRVAEVVLEATPAAVAPLEHARPKVSHAEEPGPEASDSGVVRASAREASAPMALQPSPRNEGDPLVPCFFYADTAPGGELRSVLGPCFGEWDETVAAVPGKHRHEGRAYCRHHYGFGRAYGDSLTTAGLDAASAVRDGTLPPFVRQRVGYGAFVLLSEAVPDRLACGLEERFGGDFVITSLSEPDTYAVESWAIHGAVEDPRRDEFRMELSVDGGPRGDTLLSFDWL